MKSNAVTIGSHKLRVFQRNGRWYVDLRLIKRRVWRSFGPASKSWPTVRREIEAWLADCEERGWGGGTPQSPTVAESATVGEVLRAYREMGESGLIRASTVRGGSWSLRELARAVPGAGDPDNVRLDQITNEVVVGWQRTWLREPGIGRAISGQSIARQARAVFSRRCLQAYAASPELVGRIPFDMPARFHLVWPRVRAEYHPVAQELVAKAIREVAEQPIELQLAFWLAYGAGLRANEIVSVKVGDLVCENDNWWVHNVRGKNGELTSQLVLDDAAERLAAVWPRGRHPSYHAMTSPNVIRRLNAWLRKLGWTSRKATHELRSLAICRAAERFGIDGAVLFARHADPKLTWTHYGRYLKLSGLPGNNGALIAK